MRTGLIVYVVGAEPPDWDVEGEIKTVKEKHKADLVEIITGSSGYFDVHDAWWPLLTRGMKRVTCIIGEFSPKGGLVFTGSALRLCG